jgi:hypothetical protein
MDNVKNCDSCILGNISNISSLREQIPHTAVIPNQQFRAVCLKFMLQIAV